MRGDYLFYEEKLEATQEERDLKAARRCVFLFDHFLFLLIGNNYRARRALDPLSVPPLTNRRQDRPSKPNGLTKQTFSTQVYLPGANAPRKWHIVAYFSVYSTHEIRAYHPRSPYFPYFRAMITRDCRRLMTSNSCATSASLMVSMFLARVLISEGIPSLASQMTMTVSIRVTDHRSLALRDPRIRL
jgi:hypothetical protein